tara:strand:- start:317 stop:3181 length:2865 start_codon:yes stop_codon:yes gene_type:complete
MSCRKPTYLPPCNQEEYEKANKKGIICCYKKPNRNKTKLKVKTHEDVEDVTVYKNICNIDFPANDKIQFYKKNLHDYIINEASIGEKWLNLTSGIDTSRNKKTNVISEIECMLDRELNINIVRSPSSNEKQPPIKTTQSKSKSKESNSILTLITSERFNKYKGMYNSIKECEEVHKDFVQPVTNKKFEKIPHKFDQLYYHAGDWEDMEKYGLMGLRIMNPKTHIQPTGTAPLSKIYQNYTSSSVIITLRYCFYHLKKAIFVMIRNNKLVTFLPFSNANYSNSFSKNLYFNEEDKKNQSKYVPAKGINSNMINKFKKENDIKHSIESNRKKWQINNCNIRYFGSGNVEGEHGTNIYRDMLEELCLQNDIPDCEFIINPRDFPYLRVDKKNKLLEPYEHLYEKEPPPVAGRYKNKTYLPILSTCSKNDFADIMIPSTDDWKIATKKVYWDWKNKCVESSSEPKLIPWTERISKVVFRGSATGCGITTETNVRLKAAEIGTKYPDLFDVSLVDANKRPKVYKGQPIRIIEDSYLATKNIKIDKNATLTDEEQYKFKYILHLDGHAAAFRLGRELRSGSAILIPKSKYNLWFSYKLKPYVHYVPIKEDLSDLVTQVQWCIKHDDKCKQIGKNAQSFYKETFSKTNLLNELKLVVKDIAHNRSNNFMDLVSSSKIKSKIAIITIFRAHGIDSDERIKQKEHFLEIMPNLFTHSGVDAEFFVIEQSKDGQKFNIGKLKNIGFDVASNDSFGHYVFTDIDVYPDTTLFEYYLTPPNTEGPMALGVRGTRYSSGDKVKPFLGASLKFSRDQFSQTNGYPNNFWGWGREDHVIAKRIKDQNYKLCYPEKGSLLDTEEISEKSVSAKDKMDLLEKDKQRETLAYEKENNVTPDNGLSTLNYKILTDTKKNKVRHIVVDLLFKDDKENHKDWFPTQSSNATKQPMPDLELVKIKHQNISHNASAQ